MRRPLPVVAAALALAACRGRDAGPSPERFLPADVRAAVVIPDAGRAARQLAALHATLSRFPGATDLAAARGSLAAQLGLDPLDPAGLREGGVEPRRGAALALLARPAAAARRAPLLVLPVADQEKLEALLARLARERLGAELRALEPRGGLTPISFRRAAGEPPALTYLVVRHTALVAPGPDGPDLVASAAGLSEDRSLARSAPYAAAQRALGEGVAALTFVPPGSPLLGGRPALRDGVAIGFSSGDRVLRARVAVPLGERAASLRELTGDGAAARLVGRLAPGAALVLRWDGAPDALLRRLLPALPPAERARLAARGVVPERDLPGLLGPGIAGGVWLSPALDLQGLGEATVRADPLRLLRFEAVAPIADAARVRALSEKLAPAPRGRPPRDAFRVATPSGEIAWRLDGARLLVAGGPAGALDALSARVAGAGAGWRAPTDAAGEALSGGLGGAVLDAGRLVSSVRALPEDAFGTGPSGFVVRSVVDRFLDPAARLSALSARAELAEGALVFGLEVELAQEAR